jgi:dimethylargininase
VKTIAFTREVSASINRCELTHVARSPIDLERARAQHDAFEQALTQLGCEVRRLPDADELPDAVFVQDAAIVFDEVAIIARMGAKSRWPETASVAEALSTYRPLRFIEPPGTIDGGDVVVIDRRVYVSQTSRTNHDGARQLAHFLRPLGYDVELVPVNGCLHLQSAVTPLSDDLVLANRRWVDPRAFDPANVIEIDPEEPFAANALRVGDALIYPTAFPRTWTRMERRSLRIVRVDMSELAKAEAGVTCCCILVPPAGSKWGT